MNASLETLVEVEGIGDIVAQSVREYFEQENHQARIQAYL
jgi:NAD-dependent DNA ligase